jgi:Ca2+-transporting ATPase
MKRAPRDSKEGIFAGGLGIAVIYQGALVTLITLISYFIGRDYLSSAYVGIYPPEMIGTSMAFLTLSMAEIFHAFNMRSLKGSIFNLKTQNFWLIGAGLLSFILTTAVIEINFLANAFSLANLNLREYGISLLLSIMIIPIVELVKLIMRKIKR